MDRHVFYVAGFDPRGASFYHRLLREEGKLNPQKAIVGKRKRVDQIHSKWDIRDRDGQEKNVPFTFLAWDDIVRDHWQKNLLIILFEYLKLFKIYLISGAVYRIFKLSKGPGIASLFPLILLLLFIFFSLFSGFSIYWITESYFCFFPIVFLWVIFPFLVVRLRILWLLRIYIFYAKWAQNKVPDIERRAYAFAQIIKNSLSSKGCDEVLLIGHSVGAAWIIEIMDHIEASEENLQKLKILTLGHSVPVITETPEATIFRDKVRHLSEKPFYFVDVTSVVDGACFYGVSPLHTSTQSRILCFSARFHRLFGEKKYLEIKKNKYLIHFQYLKSAEKTGMMNLFDIILSHSKLENWFQQYPENLLKA